MNVSSNIFLKYLRVVLILSLFFLSITMLSHSLVTLNKDTITGIIAASKNPFIALMVGMLATALVQSSSATTTIIISLVASNTITLYMAIPMIIGANIGTSVTSTIVAYSLLAKKKKFKRAIQVATMHDMFNVLLALILFPLEYFFNILSNFAQFLDSYIGAKETFISKGVNFSFGFLAKSFLSVFESVPVIAVIFSAVLLMVSLYLFTKVLKNFVVDNQKIEDVLSLKPSTVFFLGFGFTALLQSSSLTTSLAVPVAAYSKIKIKKFFPFLVGANLGTTVTALIVSVFVLPAALPLALIHFLFNLIGVVLFLPFDFFKNMPIYLSKKIAGLAYNNVAYGLLYILLLFFGIPFLLIFFT